MNNRIFKFSTVMATTFFVAAGCATAPVRKTPSPAELSNQVTQLQGELQAKDQQIQELQMQIQGSQQSLESPSNFSTKNGKVSKSSLIRVPGVSEIEVQNALSKAGFDPGPADGHLGKKTKAGFYLYEGRAKRVNPEISAFVKGRSTLSEKEILGRLLSAMVREAGLCLEEKVVQERETIDLAMILGTGFPPFRGGLFHYAGSAGLPTPPASA